MEIVFFLVPLHFDLNENGVSFLIPLALSSFYLLHVSLSLSPRFNEVSPPAISARILFFTYIHFPFLFCFLQMAFNFLLLLVFVFNDLSHMFIYDM